MIVFNYLTSIKTVHNFKIIVLILFSLECGCDLYGMTCLIAEVEFSYEQCEPTID